MIDPRSNARWWIVASLLLAVVVGVANSWLRRHGVIGDLLILASMASLLRAAWWRGWAACSERDAAAYRRDVEASGESLTWVNRHGQPRYLRPNDGKPPAPFDAE